MVIETTKLQFDINLDDLDRPSRSHLYEKLKTVVSIFSEISQLIWMKFSKLLQVIGLLKLMLNLVLKERTLLTSSVLCWDTYEPICFKVGLMLKSTKLYTLVSV